MGIDFRKRLKAEMRQSSMVDQLGKIAVICIAAGLIAPAIANDQQSSSGSDATAAQPAETAVSASATGAVGAAPSPGTPSIGSFLERPADEGSGHEIKLSGTIDKIITDSKGEIIGLIVISSVGDPISVDPPHRPKKKIILVKPSARWQVDGNRSHDTTSLSSPQTPSWVKGTEIVITGRQEATVAGTDNTDVGLVVGNTFNVDGRSLGLGDIPKLSTPKDTEREFFLIESTKRTRGLAGARILDSPSELSKLKAEDIRTGAIESPSGD